MAGGRFIYVAGEKLNAISRARSVTSGQTINSKFPIGRLHDGDPSEPTRWNAASAVDVQVDLNEIVDDDFESDTAGAAPSAATWTPTGSPTVSTAQANLGTKSCKLNGAGYAIATDRDLLAGHQYVVGCALYGDGTNPTEALLQNRKSGKYLDSSGAWSASLVAWFSKTTTGWGSDSQTFTVDDYATAMEFLTSHRLTIRHQTGTLDNYVDTVSLFELVDLGSIHNHNLPPLLTVDWQTKAAAADSYATALTLTKAKPAFYGRLSSPSSHRFHKVNMSGGTPLDPVQIGELVLVGSRLLTRGHDFGWKTNWRQPQDRVELERTGKVLARNLTSDEVRRLELAFTGAPGDSSMREVRDEIVRRSGSGAHNVIVVPDSTEAAVILGRVKVDWDEVRAFLNVWNYELTVAEQPGPIPIL